MSFVENVRFIIFIFLLVISAYFIFSPMFLKRAGIIVSFLESDSNCRDIKEGDVITWISSIFISDSDAFNKVLKNVKAGDFVTMVVNNKPVNCIAAKDAYLGIRVRDIEHSNIKFGVDVEGGVKFIVKPKTTITKEEIQKSVSLLNDRINFYGLRDTKVKISEQNSIQIEMPKETEGEIKNLIRKGEFEGKLEEIVRLSDNIGKIFIGDNNYPVEMKDGKILVNNSFYFINESFYLEDIKFDVKNFTNTSVILLVNVFTEKDIKAVFTDPQRSRIVPVANGYEFMFSVEMVKSGAERFAKVTKNLPTVFVGEERYLESKLVFFLDKNQITELGIPANLAGQILTTASIQGFQQTRSSAFKEKLKLESILQSGSLPTELEIVKMDMFVWTLGKEFVDSIIYVTLALVSAFCVITFIKYRNFKISVLMIAMLSIEILLVLGFVAMTQVMSGGKGISLNVPAIIGITGLIVIGISQLIIITDKTIFEKEQSIKQVERVTKSIIQNSNYIILVAIFPLLISPDYFFGLVTIMIAGVLIGTILTKPVYVNILKKATT